MPNCIYKVSSGTFALTTSAKTVLLVKAHANSGLQLHEMRVSFDGVTSSHAPALVELCSFDASTAGTAGSTPTARQISGLTIAAGFTAGAAYTAEPTVLTVLEDHLVPQDKGGLLLQWPLGMEPVADLAKGFCIRVTASAGTPNCRASFTVSRA